MWSVVWVLLLIAYPPVLSFSFAGAGLQSNKVRHRVASDFFMCIYITRSTRFLPMGSMFRCSNTQAHVSYLQRTSVGYCYTGIGPPELWGRIVTVVMVGPTTCMQKVTLLAHSTGSRHPPLERQLIFMQTPSLGSVSMIGHTLHLPRHRMGFSVVPAAEPIVYANLLFLRQ